MTCTTTSWHFHFFTFAQCFSSIILRVMPCFSNRKWKNIKIYFYYRFSLLKNLHYVVCVFFTFVMKKIIVKLKRRLEFHYITFSREKNLWKMNLQVRRTCRFWRILGFGCCISPGGPLCHPVLYLLKIPPHNMYSWTRWSPGDPHPHSERKERIPQYNVC